MFRTVPLSIIRVFFTVHTPKLYVIQLVSRIRTELCVSRTVLRMSLAIDVPCAVWRETNAVS